MSPILDPRNVWCSSDVDAAGLLVDGDDYYRSFYEAASKATRSILLCGWQFDSDMELLRGPEAEAATLPVKLKQFLNALCERNPQLEIRVLAWDFHVVFAMEREWMQKLALHWTTHERVHFRFDDNHAPRGCHHQKFVVIDGALSYVGGLDLCQHRWDTRTHRDGDPRRVSRGEPHKPFHDIQAYLVGTEAARCLITLFEARWLKSGGDALALPPPPPYDPAAWTQAHGLAIPAGPAAFSRTDPAGLPNGEAQCREVLAVHCDAIAAAQHTIYAETQYFSSHEIAEALVARLRATEKTPLDVVLVTNMEAESFKEQVAVGLAQAKIIGEVREAALGTPHRVGVFYTVPETDGAEPSRATYIHSKIMIVDDTFLCVGSANLTNRSCGVDTELNVSFEAGAEGDAVATAIRAIRLDLLSEHVGARVELAASGAQVLEGAGGRLKVHPSPTPKERAALALVDPQDFPFDPTEAEPHDPSLFERLTDVARSLSS